MLRTAALACTLLVGFAGLDPASARNRTPPGVLEQKARQCRPPLKYAAGACVSRCPRGFTDRGRVCRFRSMSR